MMQSLLYGRGVDRARKAQARLGLALFGFVLVYAIIACRLVLYAATADAHMVRRGGSTDAVATARPDILDRNGEMLATDLKTPSLFAEPRRIIDADEWRSAPQLFRRLDTNGDRRVTWEEFRADTETYQPPYNWR